MPRKHSLALALAAPVLALAVLTGCSLGETDTSRTITTPASADEPQRVRIPSIGVDSPLIRLSLNKGRTVQTPPPEKGGTAGWYTGSALPGTTGTAVIIGYRATPDGKAVFHDLHKAGRGTVIDIERGDGKVLHFTVTGTETGTETVNKAAFPGRETGDGTGQKALRLITCAGGPGDNGHPVQNLIVHATLR